MSKEGLREANFQKDYVLKKLKENGYSIVNKEDSKIKENYIREYVIYKSFLFDFLEKTQKDKVERIIKDRKSKGYIVDWKDDFVVEVDKFIEENSVLDLLRGRKSKTFTFFGESFYFMDLNNNENNIYIADEEFKYGVHIELNNRVDIAIFINGFLISLIELKNEITGQNHTDAEVQWKTTRSPKEKAFKRCPVIFSVSLTDASMTTKLNGLDTRFFPFNLGNDHGAGNPSKMENPKNESDDEMTTAYMWNVIFKKDNIKKLICDFMFFNQKKETFIFPRFHQFNSVGNICNNLMSNEPYSRFLQYDSAGSGKTLTISWLAFQLSNLKKLEKSLFDIVVIMVDQKVLDNQLQKEVENMEEGLGYPKGFIETITGNSKDLAKALNDGKRIIISTIQKYNYIKEFTESEELNEKAIAIIVDEAHSSQGKKTTKNVYEVFGETEELDESYEKMKKAFKKMKRNVTLIGFTATPKPDTLELFGTYNEKTKKKDPFNVYSTKQAIEEGFIMDVSNNYYFINSYFDIIKKQDGSKKLTKEQRMILRKDISHTLIPEKVKIILDNFNDKRKDKMNGKAKGMILTSSIHETILYYNEINKLILENPKKYNFKPLIAFSGKKTIDGVEYTEASINGFPESSTVKEFAKTEAELRSEGKKPSDEYKLLIVANKYQTGFDQPLLNSMYIDKKMVEANLFQTISRLNRIYQGKNSTFILDFVNEPDVVSHAFSLYYKDVVLDKSDYEEDILKIKNYLDDLNIYSDDDIKSFYEVFKNEKDSKFPKTASFMIRISENVEVYVKKVIKLKLYNTESEAISSILTNLRNYMIYYDKMFLLNFNFSKAFRYRRIFYELLYSVIRAKYRKSSPEITEISGNDLIEVSNVNCFETDEVVDIDEGVKLITVSGGQVGLADYEQKTLDEILENILKYFNWVLPDSEEGTLSAVKEITEVLTNDSSIVDIATNETNTKGGFFEKIRSIIDEEVERAEIFGSQNVIYSKLARKEINRKNFVRTLTDYLYNTLNKKKVS